MLFQSALPLRGATSPWPWAGGSRDFNPRSPCGERPDGAQQHAHRGHISIRAPLAGSDRRARHQLPPVRISIRAPLAGSDTVTVATLSLMPVFQSALPLRGATTARWARFTSAYFNPRSPCGERRCTPCCRCCPSYFNPRSPCGERRRAARAGGPVLRFQSALPLRGATMLGIDNNAAAEFQSALPLRGATATFCSINLLSAKCCIFKDRHRKFSRQTPQNNSEKRHNEVRTSLVEHERL